jgi:hypothetical protein
VTASSTAIAAGLELAHWTSIDLWRAALGVGGALNPAAVADLAIGERPASQVEHDILATALNDHFTDEGRDHPVPYWSQLEPR